MEVMLVQTVTQICRLTLRLHNACGSCVSISTAGRLGITRLSEQPKALYSRAPDDFFHYAHHGENRQEVP